MSIDSNGRYLSAFKQCKLQLRPEYEDSSGCAPTPKPFALFTVKAGALLFHYQEEREYNYLVYRVFPIATIAGISQVVARLNDNIQRLTSFVPPRRVKAQIHCRHDSYQVIMHSFAVMFSTLTLLLLVGDAAHKIQINHAIK